MIANDLYETKVDVAAKRLKLVPVVNNVGYLVLADGKKFVGGKLKYG